MGSLISVFAAIPSAAVTIGLSRAQLLKPPTRRNAIGMTTAGGLMMFLSFIEDMSFGSTWLLSGPLLVFIALLGGSLFGSGAVLLPQTSRAAPSADVAAPPSGGSGFISWLRRPTPAVQPPTAVTVPMTRPAARAAAAASSAKRASGENVKRASGMGLVTDVV